MSDYIKREDAVGRVAFELMYEAAIARGLSYKELIELEASKQERIKLHVQKWLEQVPSADVVEVKHSKDQIMDKDETLTKLVYVASYGGYCEVRTYRCSNCGQCSHVVKTRLDNGNIVLPNYCPNCGAKMNKEQER